MRCGPYGRAVLRACGGRWQRYQQQLTQLGRRFSADNAPLPRGTIGLAHCLFDWLWRVRPQRYEPGGNPLLTTAIAAYKTPGQQKVGNCLALTSLFLALGEEFALPLSACHVPDAGGGRPHVLVTLQALGKALDIEQTTPEGFGAQRFTGASGRQRWGPTALAAETMLARGNLALEQQRFRSALVLYRRALALNPTHQQAKLNLGIVFAELGRSAVAERWFTDAVAR